MGSRASTLRYIARTLAATSGSSATLVDKGGRLVAHERAVHDEQLLERRGRGFAAGAVHRRFGETVELQQIVQPAAADAGVDRAAVVAGLVQVGRRSAQLVSRLPVACRMQSR